MSVVMPSSGDVPEVPDALYPAVIKSVKDIDLDTPDKFGKTAKVDITVEFEVDGELVTLDPRVNRAWSEKATLFIIANACGIEANPFEPFETQTLVDKRVNILTEQEEGKWPRVKSWSRIKGKTNGTKPAQAAPVASQPPSLINIDGTLNTTEFWKAAKAAGIPRTEVAEAVGGDLNNLATTEPTEIVAMLEILIARHEGEADVPFEG